MQQIQLGIKPSIYLCLVLAAMSLLGLVCLSVLPCPWLWRALGCLMLLGASGHAILQHGVRRLKHSVVALHLMPDCRVNIQLKDGRRHEVTIMPSTVVTPLLSVVHGRLNEAAWYARPIYLLIFADAVNAEDYRRLRVYLRWGKLPD
jgi:toxin CptA